MVGNRKKNWRSTLTSQKVPLSLSVVLNPCLFEHNEEDLRTKPRSSPRSVVTSAIYCAVVCCQSAIFAREGSRINKLIHQAGPVIGQNLETHESVQEPGGHLTICSHPHGHVIPSPFTEQVWLGWKIENIHVFDTVLQRNGKAVQLSLLTALSLHCSKFHHSVSSLSILLPKLSHLVKKYLCVSHTERAFITSANIETRHGASLKPDSLDSRLVFLQ